MITPTGAGVPGAVCKRVIKANQIAKISRRSEGVVPMNSRVIFMPLFLCLLGLKMSQFWSHISLNKGRI